MASRSCPQWGRLRTRAIMSPRDMSTSSASLIVTAIGAKASSTGPSAVSMLATVELRPEGRTTTSSPGLNTPPATVPA